MRKVLEWVTDMEDQFGVFHMSAFTLSVLCLLFDVWQLFTSPNKFLMVVAIVCLLVTFLGHLKIISIGWQAYTLIYLVPASLTALSSVFSLYPSVYSAADFELAALATVISTLAPPVGASLVYLSVSLKRAVFG